MVDTPGPTGRGLLELAATLMNDALMSVDVDTAFDSAFQGRNSSNTGYEQQSIVEMNSLTQIFTLHS